MRWLGWPRQAAQASPKASAHSLRAPGPRQPAADPSRTGAPAKRQRTTGAWPAPGLGEGRGAVASSELGLSPCATSAADPPEPQRGGRVKGRGPHRGARGGGRAGFLELATDIHVRAGPLGLGRSANRRRWPQAAGPSPSLRHLRPGQLTRLTRPCGEARPRAPRAGRQPALV